MDGETGVTDRILRCAIEVHRVLGPGLLESSYETALCMELEEAGLSFRRQVGIPLHYKGRLIAEHRPDLIVEQCVLVEIKSIERFAAIHDVQVLTYLRVSSLKVGLLLNFNSPTMKSGIRRIVLNA